jgi:hypothetical protein
MFLSLGLLLYLMKKVKRYVTKPLYDTSIKMYHNKKLYMYIANKKIKKNWILYLCIVFKLLIASLLYKKREKSV